MTQLQTTETLYRLFHWKSGTYEFEPGGVECDTETVTPLRAESVLMEGFRQVDEWPIVRKRIPSMSGARLPTGAKPLPEHGRRRLRRRRAEFASLGANERRVYVLATPGPDRASKIVDAVAPGRVRDLQGAAQPGATSGYLGPMRAGRGRVRPVGAYAQRWRTAPGRRATRLV